jgi:hypothetical protein
MTDDHTKIIGALAIDVESAAIMADAMSSLLRLAEARGIPQRIAIANACAQMLLSMAGRDASRDEVQMAADLLASCVEMRLDAASLMAPAHEFSASAKGRPS